MKAVTPSHLKRPRPAYLTFAADWIADETYAAASASERGLLFSLLNRCWISKSVPADARLMAKLLQLSEDETAAAACSRLITAHFRPMESDPSRLVCPELDRQQSENAEYRRRVSEGGRLGGTRTQAKYRESRQASSLASTLAKAPEMRRDEMRRDELSKKDSSALAPNQQEWANEYTAEERAEAYRRESRGH